VRVSARVVVEAKVVSRVVLPELEGPKRRKVGRAEVEGR